MENLTLIKDNIGECYNPTTGQLIQTSGKVILPETVLYRGEIYQLTGIGYGAFENCTNLTEIHIPDSVTEIGWSAFLGCSNLNSVHLHKGLTVIGHHAFENCTNLTEIDIPDSVKIIGSAAFSGCRNLTTVHLLEGITTIGYSTFENCTNLADIHIPDSVTKIEDYAFSDCRNLTTVHLPEGITAIGYRAFANYTNLADIHIPDSVTEIGDGVFWGCSPELLISYHGSQFPLKTLNLLQKQSDGLSLQTCFDIMDKHIDITGPDVYSPVLAKKLCDACHDDQLDIVADKIQQDFQTIGFYSISSEVDLQAKEQLTEMFQNNTATRGVVPKIIDALTIASTELGIRPEEIVSAFEEKKFRDAVISMRSCHRGNRFCDVEAALFAMNFDVNTVKNVILKNPYKDYASMLLCESYVKKDEHLKDVAAWIADHPDVSSSLIHDIVKYRDQVCITKDMNVTAVQEQLSINQARMEIANIEHQYQGFHLSECICSLPKTEVTLGRYKAYIMEGNDPRQVMLGYDTDCCQHYDGAGESAMMYGLINPDAGFFVIEDTKTGRILAQAACI